MTEQADSNERKTPQEKETLPEVKKEAGSPAPQPKEDKNKEISLSGKVNLVGIIIFTIFEIVVTLLLGYAVLAFWPSDIKTVAQIAQPSAVIFFSIPLMVYGEVRLLMLIALAGALGAQVRALRSLYWYIGNRKLIWSWLVMYILLPFVGAILGATFYFVIRAGFFSASATIQDTNPIGFLALAGLTGMFSEQAVLKLKDVAETMLTKPPVGSDAAPQTQT